MRRLLKSRSVISANRGSLNKEGLVAAEVAPDDTRMPLPSMSSELFATWIRSFASATVLATSRSVYFASATGNLCSDCMQLLIPSSRRLP